MKLITKKELLAKLKILAPESDEQRNNIVCAMLGHSRIQTHCWGYYHCARCGDKLGDSLMSVYNNAETAVIVGHNCDTCRTNFKSCTWRDKIFCPDPFVETT